MKVLLTDYMKKHPRRDVVLHDVKRALTKFPELMGRNITLGLTSNGGGYAVFEDFHIRLDPDGIYYSMNTIGHELTHLLQDISDMPGGEKPCDIWTLARDEMFIDGEPTYLMLPKFVKKNWDEYKTKVRELSIQAIERRRCGLRRYIVWLEGEIRNLPRC